ncbi:hypothetical protein RHMOL_Rhmol03G0132500 [Rhododendron molle]|uniref:Uncharacterized protein n=1 Tax=Rhododendron molle TaxID=49168 RepID=A0ACC0PGA6_RHOML|nr:hypothetical protein RHMOL_Rhmol03G0132500 [Rhododendron molle]
MWLNPALLHIRSELFLLARSSPAFAGPPTASPDLLQPSSGLRRPYTVWVLLLCVRRHRCLAAHASLRLGDRLGIRSLRIAGGRHII